MSQINLMAPCRVNNTAASTLHSPAHRVTDYHHLGGVEVLAHGREGDLRISQRVPLPSRRRNERTNHSMR
jgi:hypothetical protein